MVWVLCGEFLLRRFRQARPGQANVLVVCVCVFVYMKPWCLGRAGLGWAHGRVQRCVRVPYRDRDGDRDRYS